MKKLVAVLVMLSVFMSTGVFAGDDGRSTDEYRSVQSWDFDLEIEVEGNEVELEWESFPKDKGFMWYKFVFSKTNRDPVYPNDTSEFLGGEADQNEAELYLEAGIHYVRLCAITQDEESRGRYCSKVQQIEVGEKKKHDYDKEEKYDDKKEEYYKEKKKEVLSASMKTRIDGIIKSFVEKLEDKGYSDSEMTSAINTVIQRLGEFKNKTGYKDIVRYMIVVLEKHRDEYSNPLEDLESIFDGF